MVVEEATLPPSLDLHSLKQTFCGVRFKQSWADLQLWEFVLNDNPQLRTIVELGTLQGGMSRFLHCQATERQMSFTTMDINHPAKETPGFVPLNIFEQADEVRELLRTSSPLIVLCDNGDKPREMREFAPALAAGDLLAVHDWNVEAKLDDVPDCLEFLYEPFCEALQSRTRFFVRSSTNDTNQD